MRPANWTRPIGNTCTVFWTCIEGFIGKKQKTVI